MTSGPRNRRRLMAEINVVPYIDVMLVLLIIFMITAPLLTQGVKVDLPQASSQHIDQQSKEPLVLTVDAKGRYYLDVGGKEKEPVSEQDVVKRVSAVLRRQPDLPVLVRGDQSANYGQVVYAMTLLQEAGAPSVGLLTQPPAPAKQRCCTVAIFVGTSAQISPHADRASQKSPRTAVRHPGARGAGATAGGESAMGRAAAEPARQRKNRAGGGDRREQDSRCGGARQAGRAAPAGRGGGQAPRGRRRGTAQAGRRAAQGRRCGAQAAGCGAPTQATKQQQKNQLDVFMALQKQQHTQKKQKTKQNNNRKFVAEQNRMAEAAAE